MLPLPLPLYRAIKHARTNEYQSLVITNSRFLLICLLIPLLAADDVEGSWELVFSTQLKKGYMPIRELVGFYPSREKASIDAAAGPLPIGG